MTLSPDTCKLTMSQPLVPGALDTGNWFVRWSNNSRIISSATAAGSVITIALGFGSGDSGPNVVSYSPPPSDVQRLGTLTPAAAFADFPITVT